MPVSEPSPHLPVRLSGGAGERVLVFLPHCNPAGASSSLSFSPKPPRLCPSRTSGRSPSSPNLTAPNNLLTWGTIYPQAMQAQQRRVICTTSCKRQHVAKVLRRTEQPISQCCTVWYKRNLVTGHTKWVLATSVPLLTQGRLGKAACVHVHVQKVQ